MLVAPVSFILFSPLLTYLIFYSPAVGRTGSICTYSRNSVLRGTFYGFNVMF